MRAEIFYWEIAGFLFISVAGVLFHFIHGWSGCNKIVAVFGAVNESVWEHQKLVFWPAFIFAGIESIFLSQPIEGFWFAKSISIFFMPSLIIAVYYTYTKILGRRYLAADISLFFIAAGLGQLISYRLLLVGSTPPVFNVAGLSVLLLLSLLFMLFTFFPIYTGLFKDSTNEIYGMKSPMNIYRLEKTKAYMDMGSKAKNLLFLKKNGFDIPVTYICLIDENTDKTCIREQLLKMMDTSKKYAVRSSANVEDNPDCSFAGQFRSKLNISGIGSLTESILEVFDSLKSAEAKIYMNENGISPDDIKMAVIVQEMVDSVYSGISFSKNPLTGLSELIVEAGHGSGDAGQFCMSPLQWIKKWGNWVSKPETTDIPEELIETVMEKTREITKKFGRPADIEWAYDGTRLYFLQVRPITAINIPVYSNRMSREMLPGIIKPLVWSVNTRINNERWVHILSSLTNERSFSYSDLTRQFYYRAYFNITIFGRIFERMGMPFETLEILMGLEKEGQDRPGFKPGIKMALMLPRMLYFIISLSGISRRQASLSLKKTKAFREIAGDMQNAGSAAKLLMLSDRIDEEMKDVVSFNIIVPLLAMINRKILEKLLSRHGIDAKTVNIAGLSYVTEENDPNAYLARLAKKYSRANRSAEACDKEALKHDMACFLEKFGHFSDSGNDFSVRPWRETPEIIEKMILDYAQMPEREHGRTDMPSLNLPLFSKILANYFYKKTCSFAVSRESLSSLYTYCYGHYRSCFLCLAEFLCSNKTINEREDVFYLYKNELEALASGKLSQPGEIIEKRKKEMCLYADSAVPDIIFGNSQPPLKQSNENFLKGLPASFGCYTGRAKILRSIAEHTEVAHGDIIVIPHSDVGWTPLFAKAGAVVSESGGLLSHSAIVAREYGIPAVLSVNGAMSIKDGSFVTVNGYTGEISRS